MSDATGVVPPAPGNNDVTMSKNRYVLVTLAVALGAGLVGALVLAIILSFQAPQALVANVRQSGIQCADSDLVFTGQVNQDIKPQDGATVTIKGSFNSSSGHAEDVVVSTSKGTITVVYTDGPMPADTTRWVVPEGVTMAKLASTNIGAGGTVTACVVTQPR